jgi:hypothetical protein
MVRIRSTGRGCAAVTEREWWLWWGCSEVTELSYGGCIIEAVLGCQLWRGRSGLDCVPMVAILSRLSCHGFPEKLFDTYIMDSILLSFPIRCFFLFLSIEALIFYPFSEFSFVSQQLFINETVFHFTMQNYY